MEFGKLPSISQVNFDLPPDPPGNDALLNKVKETPAGKLYIGATGWSVKEWVGKIYPKGAKPADFLAHYARQFNTIELNTTHYRIPDAFTVQHWHDEAAADFKFCPKVLQGISHSADLGTAGEAIGRFCQAMEGLHSKLGPCFIQLPPYFGADRMAVLEAFLKVFHLPVAVEARHESWFNHPLNFNRFSALLEKYGATTVVTDVAGRRDVCHMRLTTDKVLVRFVGNNLDPTDYTRIDAWVNRLENWFSRGLAEAYVFTHEPDNLLAPDLAAYLASRAQAAGLPNAKGPVLQKLNGEGNQMSLF